MQKSESIKELAKAIGKFHFEMGKIKKESNNPFFKSKYASLPTILNAIEIPLSNNDLVFSQFPDGEHLTTILIHHPSGEFIEAGYVLKPKKDDPQGWGSAITYARRYALGAILGLNIDEDDDGNIASGNTSPVNESIKWLSHDGFEKTFLTATKDQIETVLQTYSTPTKQMKQEYRTKLKERLNQLNK